MSAQGKVSALHPMLRFIGVASALGAPGSGSQAGPQALRSMGIEAAVRRAGLEAGWGATIEAPAGRAFASPLAALAALLEELAHEVSISVATGNVPIVLGGDHAMAAGTWRGVGRALGRAPGLIWIDAHLDAHTPETSLSHNPHGMPLAALLGVGAPEMCAIDGPALDPARIAVVGVRSHEADEARLLAAFGVRVFGMAEIHRRGLAAVFADAMRIAGANGEAFGISLDLDAIDPLQAPGVNTPVANGLSSAALASALAGLIRTQRCLAFEITELLPERDPLGLTARLAVELLAASCRPDTAMLRELEMRCGARNYEPLPTVLNEGKGCWLSDTDGHRYLDLMSAYSAVSFGHAHPRLVATLADQASRLAVTSRAFSNDRLPLFLKRLTDITGYDRALPVNTGAEAVETAIKAARKWAYKIKGVAGDQAEIIACHGNFHGRSTTIVGFSSEAQYRDGFGPFAPGFRLIPYGDATALAAAITPNTAAFLVEPVQGEGGIIVPPDGYLAACADICRRHNVLLIADEVQTGLGRTGYLLASQHEKVRPDGVILGKALGGGLLPVSAFLADERVMQVFTPGDHGSTFGGNTLSAAVGAEALEILFDEKLVEHSAELGDQLLRRLHEIASGTPLIRAVRGRGLFAGIEVDPALTDARQLAEMLLARGVLTKDTHGTVLRIAPPLTISAEELEWGLTRIAEVFADAGRCLPQAA
ncbi:MAG: ornithine--oxo-acid transaminase [Rhodocyclaceae bacterium]